MKSFLIILLVCAVGAYADEMKSKKEMECLTKNKLSEANFGFLIGKDLTGKKEKPNMEIIKSVPEEDLACAIACLIKEASKENKTVYDFVMEALKTLDEYSQGKEKELQQAVEDCKKKAGDDDCKLMACLKITERPFAGLIFEMKEEKN